MTLTLKIEDELYQYIMFDELITNNRGFAAVTIFQYICIIHNFDDESYTVF